MRESRLEELVEKHQQGQISKFKSIYEEYAPLYEGYIYNSYNHDKVLNLVEKYAQLEGTTIVNPIYSGKICNEISADQTIGVGKHRELLDIAMKNTSNTTIINGDLDSFYSPLNVHTYIVPYEGLSNIQPDNRREIFENIYDVLDSKATLILSYHTIDKPDGHTNTDTIQAGKWIINRNVMTNKLTENHAHFVYSYTLGTEDRTHLQKSFSEDTYLHDPREVLNDLQRIGFSNTTIVESDDDIIFTIARKVGV